jgi:hypothetical protein
MMSVFLRMTLEMDLLRGICFGIFIGVHFIYNDKRRICFIASILLVFIHIL